MELILHRQEIPDDLIEFFEPINADAGRSVFTISTQPFSEAHFACMPPDLARRCVLAGCPIDGVVLDPFAGAGTTGIAAIGYGRKFLGIELNPEYIEIMRKRLASSISQELLCFDEEATNAKT